MTILGTRPEIIRLSRVMALLDKHVDHVMVHTGQNYDYELNEVFFSDLGVRKPDYFLKIDCSTLGRAYGNVLISIETVFLKEKPDAVLILGDTNSAIAALMAKRMKIPIYHLEAGNRSFDLNVPEEINRRVIDHISDFNLVYTEHARRNLLSEGLHPRRIYLTGSPMKEIVDTYFKKVKKSSILTRLKIEKGKYIVVSLHREENVDVKNHLTAILDILNTLAKEYSMPVIVSTHPRTRKRIENVVNIKMNKLVRFLKPFGYFDYLRLQTNAFCVVSDSGTISEEAAILRFPAVTIRNAMERPEALDAGNIILTGLLPETIINAVRFVTSENSHLKTQRTPDAYEINDFSQRVARLIIGTTKLSHIWDGTLKLG
ncbi:MAG: UDP-N-acetylglucosamine 2-epimerase (non-hydrolyzing) [Pseudomonadota bacterium]